MQRKVPALEQRIAETISAYDAQGNHRTGTAVDEASARWLSKQVYNIGVQAALEPFALSRAPAFCVSTIGVLKAFLYLMPPLPAPRGCAASSALWAVTLRLE